MIDKMKSDLDIAHNLLRSAKKERKGDYAVYRAYKNQLDSLLLIPEAYQQIIKKLCNILEV